MINPKDYFNISHSSNDKFQANCPVHDDKNASLSITITNENIILHCHAGCSTKDIVQAVGLTMWDLTNKTKETRDQENKKRHAIFNKNQFEQDYLLVKVIQSDLRQNIKVSERDIELGREAYRRLQKQNCDVDELYQKLLAIDCDAIEKKRNRFYLDWAVEELIQQKREQYYQKMKGIYYAV